VRGNGRKGGKRRRERGCRVGKKGGGRKRKTGGGRGGG